jgi:hypothetical protein
MPTKLCLTRCVVGYSCSNHAVVNLLLPLCCSCSVQIFWQTTAAAAATSASFVGKLLLLLLLLLLLPLLLVQVV